MKLEPAHSKPSPNCFRLHAVETYPHRLNILPFCNATLTKLHNAFYWDFMWKRSKTLKKKTPLNSITVAIVQLDPTSSKTHITTYFNSSNIKYTLRCINTQSRSLFIITTEANIHGLCQLCS